MIPASGNDALRYPISSGSPVLSNDFILLPSYAAFPGILPSGVLSSAFLKR